MKKIYILSGVILLFVLIIMCWVFFGNFSDFANKLGKESGKIPPDEKSKFVGTWETTYYEDDDRFVGFNGTYQFNTDETGSVGGLISTWDISNGKLVIYYYECTATLTYDYLFSDNGNKLTLTKSDGTLQFTKKLI